MSKIYQNRGGTLIKILDDDELVHKTGDETISDIKVFTNDHMLANQAYSSSLSSIYIKQPKHSRGQAVTEATYAGIEFVDKNFNYTDDYPLRLGTLEWEHFEDNSSEPDGERTGIRMKVNNPDTTDESTASLIVGYTRSGTKFAACPSTPVSPAQSTHIVTRDWIPKDTRIVHMTGDETIGGIKTFNNNQLYQSGTQPHLDLLNTGLTKGTYPSSASNLSHGLEDKDKASLGAFGVQVNASSTANESLYAYMRAYEYTAGSTNYSSVNLRGTVRGTAGKSFFPGVTNTVALGNGDRLWTALYAKSATINTSDERLKQQIDDVPDNILDAWEEVNWRQFKFNDSVEEKGSDKARIHTGLIAQQIDRSFTKYGIDPRNYGFFCYDKWDAYPEVLNDDGTVGQPATPAGESYALRYEEALCIEAAYNRRRVFRAESRILKLEEKISSLENKLNNLIS